MGVESCYVPLRAILLRVSCANQTVSSMKQPNKGLIERVIDYLIQLLHLIIVPSVRTDGLVAKLS